MQSLPSLVLTPPPLKGTLTGPSTLLQGFASPGTVQLPNPAETTQDHAILSSTFKPTNNFRQPNPNHDLPATHGELYAIRPSQPVEVLRAQGETRPDGNDIPADAVSNGRIVLGVEGIDGKPSAYARMLSSTLQAGSPLEGGSAGGPVGSPSIDLQQPILMVHEGIEDHQSVSVARIMRDDVALKGLERGDPLSPDAIFAHDPAVKTTYDILKQGLEHGQNVFLIAHSGGGTESALALNLLANQDQRYRSEIHDHVKVLSLAGASAAGDYEAAGLAPNDVLYVGDTRDPVANAVCAGGDPESVRRHLIDAVRTFAGDPGGFIAHQPDTIIRENQTQIAAFLEGGPGGVHMAAPSPV